MNKIYNTRVAPSPTGFMHLGTARTAYFSYIIAKATGGKFILRIDDTDLNRNNEEYTKIIFDAIDWMGITPNEIYRQSERVDFYNEVASKLVEIGLAEILDNGAIALKGLPEDIPGQWEDSIAGMINITEQDLNACTGLILMKGDGIPTYNFCSILDDIDIDVNWIIRGTDHLSNTPKQITIIQALKK